MEVAFFEVVKDVAAEVVVLDGVVCGTILSRMITGFRLPLVMVTEAVMVPMKPEGVTIKSRPLLLTLTHDTFGSVVTSVTVSPGSARNWARLTVDI